MVGVEIEKFLASNKLMQYHALMKHYGVEDTADLADVNDNWLLSIGVNSAEHRRTIMDALKKSTEISSSLNSAAVSPVMSIDKQRMFAREDSIASSRSPVVADLATDKLEYLRQLKQRAREQRDGSPSSSPTVQKDNREQHTQVQK